MCKLKIIGCSYLDVRGRDYHEDLMRLTLNKNTGHVKLDYQKMQIASMMMKKWLKKEKRFNHLEWLKNNYRHYLLKDGKHIGYIDTMFDKLDNQVVYRHCDCYIVDIERGNGYGTILTRYVSNKWKPAIAKDFKYEFVKKMYLNAGYRFLSADVMFKD